MRQLLHSLVFRNFIIRIMDKEEIRSFLNFKADQYNNPKFIEHDPVSIPHHFSLKEDREIAGFLAATISWGNRKSILKSANKMMELLGESPFDFVMSHRSSDLKKLEGFVHRTFNGEDLVFFVKALRHVYKKHGGLETVFQNQQQDDSLQGGITYLRKIFFQITHSHRSEKHISDPEKGSAAKRINMFLRWMVRNDGRGVDLGLWPSVSPSALSCPLDVHSGNVARKLGLLQRKQNDALAVKELDEQLRMMDPSDPVKYDFALFGLGVFEGF
jgi:uncharacterized protein (TIGR02757 family)